MQDGQSVTVEPGGQLELSGAPLEDVHAVERELDVHLEEVNLQVLREFGHEPSQSYIRLHYFNIHVTRISQMPKSSICLHEQKCS